MDALLRREGDVWAIQLDGRTARVRDSRGMQHLAVLLARPDSEVHVLELAGTPETSTSADRPPLLDDTARAAYKQRLSDLASDLDEADAFNDIERSARIQAEIDALVDHLTAATGLGGKDRGAVTDAERARVAVRRAVKSALDHIAEAHPAMGAHLAATVRTGAFCSYVPDPASPVRWLVGDAPEAAPLPRPVRPLIVGREPERAALRDAWDSGGVVLVSGEPGIGKTTLLRDLEADVDVSLHGRCDDHLGVPYQPIVEAIRMLIAVDGATAVANDSGVGAGVLSRLVPELGIASITSDAPDTERLILFDAITRVLRAAAARRPVLLSVDDLHWAPQPTLALLLHMLHDLDGASVLAVLTYRDTEVGDDLTSFLAGVARLPNVTRVSLAGIDVEAIFELGASADDAKRLAEHTNGNPFFVRALLDAPLDDALPSTVLDVVTGRVQRLSNDARRLLSLAAAAGDRLPVGVAAALAGDLDPLDELLAAGLLVEDGTTIAFPHALVRRAITETTSGVRRASLHHEVALALEAAGAPPAQLAYHFTLGAHLGGATSAVRYAIEAADSALRTMAFEEAIAHAERGLTIATEGTRSAAVLLLRLGEAHHASGDLAAAQVALAEAARTAAALDDRALIADVAIERGDRGAQVGEHEPAVAAELAAAVDLLGDDDPVRRSRLLGLLAIECAGDGQLERAHALAAEALTLARVAGDHGVLVHALRSNVFVLDAPEHLDRRAAIAGEIDVLARAGGDLGLQVTAAGALVTVASERGDVEALDRTLAEMERLVRLTCRPRDQWYLLELQVMRAVMAGDLDHAEELAERELSIGTAASVPNAFRGYALQLLVIRYEQGRAGELAGVAISMAEEEGFQPGTTTMAAFACMAAGRHDDARRLMDVVGPLEDLPRDSLLLGVLRAAAEMALCYGDVGRASVIDEMLRPFAGRNVSIALGTISVGPVDRFLSWTARVLGDQERAHDHLVDAIALDERMGAPRWLARDLHDLATLSGVATT